MSTTSGRGTTGREVLPGPPGMATNLAFLAYDNLLFLFAVVLATAAISLGLDLARISGGIADVTGEAPRVERRVPGLPAPPEVPAGRVLGR